MPAIRRRGDRFEYTTYGNGWFQWAGPETENDEPLGNNFPDEGWKLHIGGTPDNAQTIYDAVADDLIRLKMGHKVLPSTEALEQRTGEDAGKWLVAYPRSMMHALWAIKMIDDGVRRAFPGAGRETLAIPVANEIPVGQTVVFARYGSFRHNVVRRPDGAFEADSRTVARPGWIANPWGRFNELAVAVEGPSPTVFPAEWAQPFPVYSPDLKAAARRYG